MFHECRLRFYPAWTSYLLWIGAGFVSVFCRAVQILLFPVWHSMREIFQLSGKRHTLSMYQICTGLSLSLLCYSSGEPTSKRIVCSKTQCLFLPRLALMGARMPMGMSNAAHRARGKGAGFYKLRES